MKGISHYGKGAQRTGHAIQACAVGTNTLAGNFRERNMRAVRWKREF